MEEEPAAKSSTKSNMCSLKKRRLLANHFCGKPWEDLGVCSCPWRQQSVASADTAECSIRCIAIDDGDLVADWEIGDPNYCLLERQIEIHIVESSNAEGDSSPLLHPNAPWRRDLSHLVRTVRSKYNPNLFHSYHHATHVTLSANALMGALQPLLSDQHTHLSNNKDDNFIQIHQSHNQKDLRRASSGSVSFIIQATNTLERFAFLYTALIHDIQHVGISNEQLESEGHPVVLRAQQLHQNNIDLSDHSDKVGYNNVDIMKSYAECNSVEIGLNLLLTGSDFDHDDDDEEEEVVGVEGMGEKMKKRRRYQHLRDVLFGFAGENGGENNQQQQQQQRQQLIQTFTELVRHMVMCTDIASAERRKLGMERFERSFDKLNIDDLSDEEEDINIGDHHDDNDDLNSFLSTEDIGKLRQRAMLEQLVQLADVSHLTQSWETFLKWNRQLYVELVEAYQRRLRGLEEKQLRGDDANITKAMPPHPSNGWYQDQISFYDFYIIPLTERVQRSCALREDIILSIMENAKRNRARWVEEGLNATEKIISSAASSVGGGFVAVPLDDGDSGGLKALEKSVAKVNFGDCDDDDDEEDDVVGTADSFYRLGCNLPICVVQYLKEEACKVLAEMEPQSRPLSRWGSSSALRDNNDGTTVTEKWSWKRSSKGSDTSLLDDRSSSLYSKRRFSDVSRGSLSDDFMCDTWNSNNPLFPFPLPPQPSCHAALLLVDISGFTRLSTLLDVESLSRVINSFFEELLKEVQRYGGDVLKFAGDAFFCAWMIPSTDNHDAIQIAEQGKQVCLSAALCGASLVSKFASYFIPGLPVKDASLSVHCGLGVGTLKLIHVGDNTERREFLFLGDPVKQVAGAIECALPGDLAASSYAKECLEGASGCWCNFAADDSNGPSVIARCSDKFFGLIEGNEVQMFVGAIESVLTCPLQNAANLRQQMELYVHPSALQDRGDGSKKRRGRNQALASAELRRVFTMFVKPDVDPTLSLDKEKDAALFALLNDIMNITQSVVKRFKGHLRQFIIDDKGVVLILSWGQRGATYPHLVAEKGLPAAIALQNAFRFDLNIESRIGATVGPTYCGVLGGNNRHEFTILGSSVNLAARLACSHINEGILVDDAVRKAADDSFDFFTLEPVFAKGYDGLVPIFEPQSAIDRRWKRVDHFVGREPELEQLVRVARQMLTPKSKITTANLALIQAHSGLGKSSFSMQAVERIRKLGRTFRTDVTVLRNVCRDGEEFVPFSVFQKIILDLLVLKASIDNDFEDDSSIEISAITFDETPVVEGTSSDELQLQRLRSLCAEMNYSDGIAIWLGYHLFDLRPHLGKKEVQVNDDSKISPEDAVAFIADAFLTCISSLDFVLLGIDDGHCIDELSWRVLNLLLKRGGNNLMVLVTSRPLDSAAQADKVKPILEGLREQKCLTDLELKPFSYDDVRELISKSIGCEGRLVDEQVLQVVFEQSGGMPFFCTELIKDIIEKDLTEIHQDGTVGWKDSKAVVQKGVYSNMNDFLLHRLDRLSSHGTELLQLCALLGLEFSLSELLLVRFEGWPSRSQVDDILKLLSDADKDAILNQTCQTGTVKLGKRSTKDPGTDLPVRYDDRTYMFPHSMWRDCLLGTMLKEQRQRLQRYVAKKLEEEYMQEEARLDHRQLKQYLKIFLHWNESGDLIKATNLAKRIGKHLASLQLHQQSLDVCMEAMKAWKKEVDSNSDDVQNAHIGGIPLSVIMRINADDLVCLAQLHIAIARNPLLYNGGNYDSSYYTNCQEILRRAPAASKMTDRSVFFTLYSGLFLLYKNKYIEDEDGSAQELMATDFVEQAKLHGDPIHIARALAMEGLTLGLAGKYEEALVVQKQLEEVYSPELTEGIIREYTSDRAAQNFGYSVLWYELLDRHNEADSQIDYIINQLMPKMDQRDVHNAFVILLPVVWVLLDKGEACRAEKVFLHWVCDNYDKFYGDDSSSSTYYFYLYKPLRFLLRLSCNAASLQADDVPYDDIEQWIVSDDFCTIQRYLASYMCALGKDSNAILAEICLLLATGLSSPTGENKKRAERILSKGLNHIKISMKDTEGAGCDYARRQTMKIKRRFESAMNGPNVLLFKL